jgi:NADH-quinone oxidoreductase subunit G
MAAIAGDLCDAESMLALKDLMTVLGSPNIDCRQDGTPLGGAEVGFLFNSGIAGFDEADAIFIVGSNPRWEAPIVNARLRKRFLRGGLKLAMIGPRPDLTVPYDYLGAGAETLREVAEGRHPFAEVLKAAQKPMLILGQGALARSDGAAVLALAHRIGEGLQREGWNGFNVLHTAAARVGGLLLGFLPGPEGRNRDEILAGCEAGEIKLVYLLGADELPMERLGRAFVVYQGHHGDAGAARADVVLPGAAYTEKNGTYVNTEGRVQLGRLAVFPPGEAREDWTIVRALSGELGRPLPYSNLGELRAHLIESHRRFARLNELAPGTWAAFGKEGPLGSEPFRSPVRNYWMTDPISRASPTMAECVEVFLPQSAATGTAG